MTNHVIVEKVINASVDEVWRALTDKEALKKWCFDIPDFDPAPGAEFRFYGEGKNGEKFLHLCKVIEVKNAKKLSYSWKYDGYEGNSLVTFELFPENNSTLVRVTHEGLETFPKTPDNAFARENFTDGWTYLIGTSLKEYLEKRSV